MGGVRRYWQLKLRSLTPPCPTPEVIKLDIKLQDFVISTKKSLASMHEDLSIIHGDLVKLQKDSLHYIMPTDQKITSSFNVSLYAVISKLNFMYKELDDVGRIKVYEEKVN
jgi:hypothetical protein